MTSLESKFRMRAAKNAIQGNEARKSVWLAEYSDNKFLEKWEKLDFRDPSVGREKIEYVGPERRAAVRLNMSDWWSRRLCVI